MKPRKTAAAFVLLGCSLVARGGSGEAGTPVGKRPASCQVATLGNGFTIRYARHETAGSATRLWVCADSGDGYMEIPTEQIADFGEREQGGEPAAVPAPATAAEATPHQALPPKNSIRNLIAVVAARYQIDADFVTSVVKAESGFNPSAVSPKGARGLMQLMPTTAAGLGVGNVLDPAQNVDGGTKFLRYLLDRYNGDAAKALAAYNAGPQRVQQYGGVPPYAETRAYISRIIEDYNRKKLQQQAQSTPPSGN